jgi:putative transposase
MPSRNIIKTYLEEGYYHLYNRGVEKRIIFQEDKDYKVFLYYLKRYLTKAPENTNEIKPRFKNDLYNKIQLVSYCLMPNHFHLLVKQVGQRTIVDFMRVLTNCYTGYFNQKHERVGALFQGTYKGVLVDNESYLLHLSRYIHLNPLEINNNLLDYPYSSYGDYLCQRNTSWVHPEEILAFFKETQKTLLKNFLSYKSFLEDYKEDPSLLLGSLAIDTE